MIPARAFRGLDFGHGARLDTGLINIASPR